MVKAPYSPSAGGRGSVPGWGTKIPACLAVWLKETKSKTEFYKYLGGVGEGGGKCYKNWNEKYTTERIQQ